MNIKKLLIKAKRDVFSEMVGNNPSRFHGEGYDFSELREYQVGDDIKFIDWNITAKMQKPYVKVFHEERELHVSIVSMLGGGLHFGSSRFKSDLLKEVVALLSFSVIKNGDILSSYVVQDDLQQIIRPSKKEFSVRKSIEHIDTIELIGHQANYENLSHLLMKRIKRKSMIIIVGDFFEIPDLKVLSKKHEVIAIVLRDKMEEKPPKMGFASLMDPENSANLEGNFSKKAVQAYAAQVKAHDKRLIESFRKANIRYTKIYTDDNAYLAIRRLFGV